MHHVCSPTCRRSLFQLDEPDYRPKCPLQRLLDSLIRLLGLSDPSRHLLNDGQRFLEDTVAFGNVVDLLHEPVDLLVEADLVVGVLQLGNLYNESIARSLELSVATLELIDLLGEFGVAGGEVAVCEFELLVVLDHGKVLIRDLREFPIGSNGVPFYFVIGDFELVVVPL
jgi:hypothetical protein